MARRTPHDTGERTSGLPRVVAAVAGALFAALGLWAMAGPEAFFRAVARFDPYNRHFIQDIGAFQIGLGAVLLLASSRVRTDGLAVALLGVGAGSAAHTVSHLVGIDLGGSPSSDIPFFVALTAALVWAGWARSREVAGTPS